jgi:hypothetical protein
MLSEKEKEFIQYWEANREEHSGFLSKLSRGLPMAMVFVLPILLSILVVYLFFPEWYTKISSASTGSFGVIVIAVMIAVLFFSYFRMHFKWEMNDQAYQEIKAREKHSDAAKQ